MGSLAERLRGTPGLKGAVRLRWGVVSRGPSTARLAWRAAPLRVTTFAGMLRQNSVQLAANQKSGNWDFSFILHSQLYAGSTRGSDVTRPVDVFAERRLRRRSETESEDILVQFGPVIRQDDAAFCRYTLTGADGELTRDIWGVDDVQAIQLAMAMAGADLDRLADGGRYRIIGDSNGEGGHGFPTLPITPYKSAL